MCVRVSYLTVVYTFDVKQSMLRVCVCVCVPSNFRAYFRCETRQDSLLPWNDSVCVWETRKYAHRLEISAVVLTLDVKQGRMLC